MNEKEKETKKFVKAEEARKHFSVGTGTLRRWADEGKIEFVRTPGNVRLYNIQSITDKEIIRTSELSKKSESTQKISYCYCRVSTNGQKPDLERQVAFMSEAYPTHTIVTDIGSGINFKRKGLTTILDNCIQGIVKEVVVAYKDRLCRFGFDMLEWIFSKYNVQLLVLNKEVSEPEAELTRDLLSIINVFSARINGRRKYKTNKNKKKDKQSEEEEEREGCSNNSEN